MTLRTERGKKENMSREIVSHRVNGLNDRIEITVLDERGEGGANHDYMIRFGEPREELEIMFQKGPLKVAGYNGISNEALLAVVIDRLEGFANGPFACRENAMARTKCEEAMQWLLKRTRDRMERGVEGQNIL